MCEVRATIPRQTLGAMLVFARSLAAEARGEAEDSLLALAAALCNRAALGAAQMRRRGEPHPLFGDGALDSVCRAAGALGCWRNGAPPPEDFADPEFGRAFAACALIASGAAADPTRGATLWHRADTEPDWARSAEPLALIGPRAYYRPKEPDLKAVTRPAARSIGERR